MRFVLAMFVTVAALGAAPTWAQASVEPGKVFTGPEGEEVVLVPLTTGEGKRFLVRVQGTGTEFDGLVLPHEENDWSSRGSVRINYVTQRRGRDFATLVVRDASRELYVPGRRKAIPVKFDEARSQKLKAADLHAQYQKQTKDGSLAKLMAFDRAAEVADQDRAFSEELKSLNASCGTAVAASIDWSTIDDALLKSHSISSYCGTPLSSLRALCDVSDEAKRTVKEKVKRVDCRFGTGMELRIEPERILWTTEKDAANQEAFATHFFKKNL